eukprot:348517-Rhodomonas_salina.1
MVEGEEAREKGPSVGSQAGAYCLGIPRQGLGSRVRLRVSTLAKLATEASAAQRRCTGHGLLLVQVSLRTPALTELVSFTTIPSSPTLSLQPSSFRLSPRQLAAPVRGLEEAGTACNGGEGTGPNGEGDVNSQSLSGESEGE